MHHEFQILNNNTNFLICDKLCRINISQCYKESIASVSEEVFERINKSVFQFLERSKKESIINVKKNLDFLDNFLNLVIFDIFMEKISEKETRKEIIDPQLEEAGWNRDYIKEEINI